MSQLKKLIPGAIALMAMITVLLSAYWAIQNGTQDPWQSLTVSGASAMRAGKDKLAEEYFSQALKTAEAENQKPNEEELITSLQNLGLCYEKTRRYDEAAKLYSRMALVTQSKYGTKSPEYEEAVKVLRHVSLKSPLLQKCPTFRIDENSYDKI
jgi:tetratricopeptide (TPR) repeat protein